MLFLFLAPLRVSSSRYRYVTKQGKKETIWKRSGTNQASIVKSGIEGANYYEGEEKKEARTSETMRPPMEILVGSPFIYFAALPDFLL